MKIMITVCCAAVALLGDGNVSEIEKLYEMIDA